MHRSNLSRSAVLITLLVGWPATVWPASTQPATSDQEVREQRARIPDACSGVISDFELPDRERAYHHDTVTFSIQFKDEVNPYRLMSAFVMPAETLTFEAVFSDKASLFDACASGGTLERLDAAEWQWTAPEKPGAESVFFTENRSGETMQLQIFVMTPYASEDFFNGYRIGKYERIPLRNNPKYNMPTGLLEVREDMLDIWVSPHFQLRQFMCKQESDSPKYMILNERLLLKLELLLEKVNDGGIKTNTFAVLSGYRTPHYNRAIGNTTRYSRHLYGDSADIYIDRDGDGRMDDITGDGKVTMADAKKLASIIEKSFNSIWYRPFIGGLGLYGPKPHRGPFIHVDTRGFKARW